MPLIVKFSNTTSTPTQSQVLPNATSRNDGVMTKEQAAKLEGITPGGGFANEGKETFSVDGLAFVLVNLPTPHTTTGYRVFLTAGLLGPWTGPGEALNANYVINDASSFYIYLNVSADCEVSWGTIGATP